jgi:hypothetical protein
VGLNKHYTEYSYTIFTDADVAKKTGFKDVVLGTLLPGFQLDRSTTCLSQLVRYSCTSRICSMWTRLPQIPFS